MPKKINLKGPVVPSDVAIYYNYYGIDCTCAKTFLEQIEGESEIEIIVNSPGGYVHEASEIYTALMDFKGKVTAKVVGLAASAASFIIMAADTVSMSPTALMMIHNASSVALGDRHDMESATNCLTETDSAIRSAYIKKTGLKDEELNQLMDAETWLNATNAKEKGFVDEVLFSDEENMSTAEILDSLTLSQEKIVNLHMPKNGKEKIMDKDKQKEKVVEDTLSVKNLKVEDLKAENPDLYNAIFDAGVEAERVRIQEVENLSIPGAEEIVNRAKFETGDTAAQVAVNIVTQQKAFGDKFLNDFVEDKGEIALENMDNGPKDSEEDDKKILDFMVNAVNKGVK